MLGNGIAGRARSVHCAQVGSSVVPAGEDMQTGPPTGWALGARGLIIAGLVLNRCLGSSQSPRPTSLLCRLQEAQVQESDRQAGKKAGKKAASSAQPDSEPGAESATAAASPVLAAQEGAPEAAKKDQDGNVAMQDAGAGPSSSDAGQHAGKLTGRLQ